MARKYLPLSGGVETLGPAPFRAPAHSRGTAREPSDGPAGAMPPPFPVGGRMPWLCDISMRIMQLVNDDSLVRAVLIRTIGVAGIKYEVGLNHPADAQRCGIRRRAIHQESPVLSTRRAGALRDFRARREFKRGRRACILAGAAARKNRSCRRHPTGENWDGNGWRLLRIRRTANGTRSAPASDGPPAGTGRLGDWLRDNPGSLGRRDCRRAAGAPFSSRRPGLQTHLLQLVAPASTGSGAPPGPRPCSTP